MFAAGSIYHDGIPNLSATASLTTSHPKFGPSVGYVPAPPCTSFPSGHLNALGSARFGPTPFGYALGAGTYFCFTNSVAHHQPVVKPVVGSDFTAHGGK